MTILAHRGLWCTLPEKNTAAALARALTDGFGLETDIRDAAGELVVSHDPAVGTVQPLTELLALYECRCGAATLALNIKADGLCPFLRVLLDRHRITDYFCFDMSVPETFAYQRECLRFYTRESEYETAPVLYAESAGVWMDQFTTDWITPARIARHLDAGKQVAIVSPELHGRPHLPFWQTLLAAGPACRAGVLLCTDHPSAARQFFHD